MQINCGLEQFGCTLGQLKNEWLGPCHCSLRSVFGESSCNLYVPRDRSNDSVKGSLAQETIFRFYIREKWWRGRAGMRGWVAVRECIYKSVKPTTFPKKLEKAVEYGTWDCPRNYQASRFIYRWASPILFPRTNLWKMGNDQICEGVAI